MTIIHGVPLRHLLASEIGGQVVLNEVTLPDTWAELDQLDAPAGAGEWLAGALAAVEADFGFAAARAVGFAAETAAGGCSLALLAVFVTFCDPTNTVARQAAELAGEPFVADVSTSGNPDRQVLRCRVEERVGDEVLHQLHARVVFPAFRTAVIVHLMTPVDGQAEFSQVFDEVVASVRLP